MALRDLVVLLDGSSRDEIKLAVAVELARRNDAHLTGLCPLELLLPADMSFALGGYPDLWALPEFAKQVDSQARARAALRRRDQRGRDCASVPHASVRFLFVLLHPYRRPLPLRTSLPLPSAPPYIYFLQFQ